MAENKIIHISIGSIDFECPHCKKKYKDENEIYLNRCNKNRFSITTIKCVNADCRKRFGFTHDYKGNAMGFKL